VFFFLLHVFLMAAPCVSPGVWDRQGDSSMSPVHRGSPGNKMGCLFAVHMSDCRLNFDYV